MGRCLGRCAKGDLWEDVWGDVLRGISGKMSGEISVGMSRLEKMFAGRCLVWWIQPFPRCISSL